MRSLVSNIKIFSAAASLLFAALNFQSKALAQATTFDNKSAVILSYQQIGEDFFPDTSVRIEQFAEHIHELIEGSYNIIPLPELINKFQNNEIIEDKTVVITFDGGYRSVSFGLHPASYTRLSNKEDQEIKRQLFKAKTDLREILKTDIDIFAYPFGEYSANYKEAIKNTGFQAALTQHSSVSYIGQDLYELPRFTMTEKYADIERFRLIINALPLPVTDISPKSPKLDNNKPVIGFTLNNELINNIKKLACFASNQGKPLIEVIGENRIELRLINSFSKPRARINCTIPGPQSAPGEPPRWRWFGRLMTVPNNVAVQ
jgi:hypothetical protein